jgi:Leucine-rich repeat (LRR) protein
MYHKVKHSALNCTCLTLNIVTVLSFACSLSLRGRISNLTTLDVSRNNLQRLGPIYKLHKLKSLQCDENKLTSDSLSTLVSNTTSSKLQSLSAGGNLLGKELPNLSDGDHKGKTMAALPASLKQLVLTSNHFSSVPPQVCSPSLTLLEKLDLSHNHLAAIPTTVSNLKNLHELVLDYNLLVSIPNGVGSLSKLKVLSLKYNCFTTTKTTVYDDVKNPQPLPRSLFEETLLIDLNLHGNKMTFTALSNFDGFDKFLERRKHIKSKDIYGGALTNLDVCGLD